METRNSTEDPVLYAFTGVLGECIEVNLFNKPSHSSTQDSQHGGAVRSHRGLPGCPVLRG